jgi:hypothetical protein
MANIGTAEATGDRAGMGVVRMCSRLIKIRRHIAIQGAIYLQEMRLVKLA